MPKNALVRFIKTLPRQYAEMIKYIWKSANRQMAGIKLAGGEYTLLECTIENMINIE